MLNDLSRDPAVAFVHPSDPLALDRPEVTSAPPGKKPTSKAIGSAKKNGRGEGVLIGIIDVGGFDFAHPDFLDEEGQTRFVAIWDQGGDFRPPPKGFSRGSEFRQSDLNAAIEAAKKPGLPPAQWIERQSQLQPGSHGTHVASIAAGNSGVCPKAKIAAVLIDIPAIEDDVERRRSTFSDTSSITHAVEYLLDIAQEENLPISINISLGTNGGSHDGSSGVSRWLDAYLAQPGRAICVAAGNAGQEKAQAEGDLGWIMGRIHTSGQIPARGLEVEIEWTVVGDGIEDWSENELEIWYGAQDRFIVSLKPPGASDWIEVQPREYVENRRLAGGVTVSIYNELYHPDQRRQLHRRLSLPESRPGEFSRHPQRDLESAPQRRRSPRRAVRRLDRAGRPDGDRPRRAAPHVPLSFVLHREVERRLALDYVAGLRSPGHRGRRTWTRRSSRSTPPAARARRATAAASRRSPRPARE